MRRLRVSVVVVIILIAFIVLADTPDTPSEHTRTPTTEKICRNVTTTTEVCNDECLDFDTDENGTVSCIGGISEVCRDNVLTYETCELAIHSGIQYAQNSSGDWIDAGDVFSITKDSDDITFHYNGVIGEFDITFEAGVIHNGNYYSFAEIKGMYPQIEFSFPSWQYPAYKKYAVNISDIPVGVQPGVESITLTYKDHNGFTLDQLKRGNRRFHIKNKMALKFDDLIEQNNTIRINMSERRLYIENLTFVDNSLWLDPTVQIEGNDSGVLEDAEFDEDHTDSGAEDVILVDLLDGTGELMFIKFNISSIPVATVTNATLGLYAGVVQSSYLDLWYVANQTWKEEEIDDLCGDGAVCSSVWDMFTTKIRNYTYGSVTTNVWVYIDSIHSALNTELLAGNDNISFVLNNTGGAGESYSFYSKENADTSKRPFLNVTYTEGYYTVSDCTVLDLEGATYRLDQDIVDSTTTKCFDIQANSVTLDCYGYKIDSTDGTYDYGIYSANYNDTTVKNCTVTDWDTYAIYFTDVYNVTVKDINASSNVDSGVGMNDADGINLSTITSNDQPGTSDTGLILNTVTNSFIYDITANNNDYGMTLTSITRDNTFLDITTNDNDWTGIEIDTASHRNNFTNVNSNRNQEGMLISASTDIRVTNSNLKNNTDYDVQGTSSNSEYCEATFTGVNGTDNKPIVYISNKVDIQDWDNNVSQIILCNASDSIINNLNISKTDVENSPLWITTSHNLTLSNFNFTDVGEFAIWYSSNSTIANYSQHASNGVYWGYMDNTQISNLEFTGYQSGEGSMYMRDGSNLVVDNVTITNPSDYGIYLSNIDNSNFSNMAITKTTGSDPAIWLGGSNDGNRFFSNKLRAQEVFDVRDNGNYIYNNLINGTISIDDPATDNNNWNTSEQAGTRIYSDGNNIGGNYWTNSSGDGYSDTCTDADADGFCDNYFNVSSMTETTIEGVDVDYLPLSDEVDATVPTFAGLANNASSPTKGVTVKWNVTISDAALDYYKFAHNQSGTMTNATSTDISGTSYIANETLEITLTKDNYICGVFWANDTNNNVAQSSESCITIVNSEPTLKTDLSFTNFTAGHSFNVTATFTDLDTASDLVSHTIENSTGSCTYVSNSTSGDDMTIKYNCTGTALTSTTIRINATDASSVTASSSELINAFPNQVPTVASATINDSSPGPTVDLQCDNGSVADVDLDTVTLLYDWYNDTWLGINNKVLGAGNTSTGQNWQCKITPFDGYENGSTETSASVSIGTGLVAPVVTVSNATTTTTGVNSSTTNPTNNNSWMNFSITYTDSNADEMWSIYACDTSTPAVSGCDSTEYCSIINTTDKTVSCRVNATGLTSSTYTYYVFVADNNSLVSTSVAAEFNINHPPTIPSIVEPADLAYVTTNFTLINYSSTDSNSDTINYTIYNSTDNVTWSQLYSGTGTYNWTNLTEDTYYLQAYSTDQHGYSLLQNSTITIVYIDTEPPTIVDLSASSYSPTTATSVTFSATVTDVAGVISSNACEFQFTKSDYNSGEAFNLTTNTLDGVVVSVAQSMSTYGTGTLQWTHAYCSDDSGNQQVDSNVALNLSISSPATSSPGGGGGGGGVEPECSIDEDCFDLGLNWYCVDNHCVKLERDDIAYSNLLAFGLAESSIQQLLNYGQGICNWDDTCEIAAGESRFNCATQTINEEGQNIVVPGDCTGLEFQLPSGFLMTMGAIGLVIILILYISNVAKKRRKK